MLDALDGEETPTVQRLLADASFASQMVTDEMKAVLSPPYVVRISTV